MWRGSKLGSVPRPQPARAAVAGGAGDDATRIVLEARDREARGAVVEPSTLALSEACIGLWERALASATVEPADSMALAGVTPAVLGLTGRMLATRGNAVFAIEVMGGDVALHSAATWDPRGGHRQTTRWYYLTMSGPQHTVTHTVHGDGVLHFKVGATEAEWWRGRGPLYRSSATAALAARLERQMGDEAKIPVGRIVPLAGTVPPNPDGTDALSGSIAAIKKGGVAVVTTGQGAGLEQNPASRYQPQRMGAHPAETLTALRTEVGQEIVAAFGVPPALIVEGADGTAQRESWRRFWTGTVAPLGALIQAELRRKLDPAAMVSFEALRASDEDGRSRALARRAQAAKTLKDMGLGRDEALRRAGLDG